MVELPAGNVTEAPKLSLSVHNISTAVATLNVLFPAICAHAELHSRRLLPSPVVFPRCFLIMHTHVALAVPICLEEGSRKDRDGSLTEVKEMNKDKGIAVFTRRGEKA